LTTNDIRIDQGYDYVKSVHQKLIKIGDKRAREETRINWEEGIK
jgi:hypothetical protein